MMESKMRYAAISRATSKKLISILDETERVVDEINDTGFRQVFIKRKEKRRTQTKEGWRIPP
jgi:hypothetical protein